MSSSDRGRAVSGLLRLSPKQTPFTNTTILLRRQLSYIDPFYLNFEEKAQVTRLGEQTVWSFFNSGF